MAESCERLVRAGLPLWRVGVFVRTLHPDIFGRNFIWRPGAEVESARSDFDILEIAGIQKQPAGDRLPDRTGGQVPARRSREQATFRSSRTCAPKASRITSRCRCRSSTARFTPRAGPPSSRAASPTSSWPRCGQLVPPLARMHRDHQPAPHRLDPARHLCRQPRRRADSRRPDPPRPHRDHACRDLAVGSARLYRAVGPAAGRDRGRYSQSIFRLPGDRDPGAWRRSAEISWATGCSRCFRSTNMSAMRSRSARACWKRRANPAPASRHAVSDRRHHRAFSLRRRAACRRGSCYGNIGGGNRLDFTCIGPAVNLAARLEKIASRLHRTVVASEGFAGICSGGWSDLGEFPIAGFSKAERVYGLSDETPAELRPRKPASELLRACLVAEFPDRSRGRRSRDYASVSMKWC